MRRFRLHFIGLPHTSTGPEWCHCAYSAKIYKAQKMFSRRGHTCIDYANEGSTADCERVQIFSEAERVSFFGPHEKQKLYHIVWDPSLEYWQEYNRRCVEALRPRVKKGDFILTLAGNCQVGPIGDAFPGSYGNLESGVCLTEWGIGYYGTQSRFRVFESNSHREWMMGRVDQRVGDFDTAVVPNFFDMDEFPFNPPRPSSCAQLVDNFTHKQPYALFIGRVISDKGFDVAIESSRDAGIKLVIAGQGDPGELPPHAEFFGHANVEERAWLMTHATAVLAPTRFREPFGGTAVESQLCGTPAITTDWGAFTETVDPKWRCSTHREFVEAIGRARELDEEDRRTIRWRASRRFSLDAVAPLYERYFTRVLSLWWNGYYQMDDIDNLELPSGPVETVVAEAPPPSDICDFAKITDEETPQAIRLASWMKSHHEGARILDVGCGPGIYVEEMRKVGIEAFGVDNDDRLVESDCLIKFDVTGDWNKFGGGLKAFPNIVVSLEVGEHVPEDKAGAYIDFISNCAPDLIYFSAARPGQGGNGHINLQPKSYWIEKFHQQGYWLDLDSTEEWLAFIRGGYHLGWLTQNGMILRRT